MVSEADAGSSHNCNGHGGIGCGNIHGAQDEEFFQDAIEFIRDVQDQW